MTSLVSDPTAIAGMVLVDNSEIRSTEDIPEPSAPRRRYFSISTLVGLNRMSSVPGSGPRSAVIALLLRVAVMA